jgi:oxygen-independent coproporphyrinogen III oxidase
MMRPRSDLLAGVYVHIPFCDRVCPYCDFAVTARRDHDHAAYVDAVLAEWAARRAVLAGRDVRTIYLGGGTPSRLERGELVRLVRTLAAAYPGVEEVTMEANPQDVTEEAIGAWMGAGVSRVSLGVQSFQDATLKALGRNHSGAQAYAAASLLAAREGLRVSVDLIYGTPSQDEASWSADLAALAGLEGLDHVSLYQLTIEPGTPFARRQARGVLGEASEEGRGVLEELTAAALEGMGFERYEVSSWGRPGAWSRHNALYWRGGEWLGLGVGAHGAWYDARGPVRSANPRQIGPYMADPAGSAALEVLTGEEALAERVFANLRTRLGLEIEVLRAQAAGLDAGAWSALEGVLGRCEGMGWLERRGEVLVPTLAGMDMGDTAAEWIWEALVR